MSSAAVGKVLRFKRRVDSYTPLVIGHAIQDAVRNVLASGGDPGSLRIRVDRTSIGLVVEAIAQEMECPKPRLEPELRRALGAR
jgi:hypothetical protein